MKLGISKNSEVGLLCTAVLIGCDPPPHPPPAFGLICEVAIGQPRKTTSLFNPLLLDYGAYQVPAYS
jgi:hypothetical protein